MAPDTNLSDFTVLLRGLGDSLKDLIMFTPRRQRGSNPCAVNNGGCAELCLYNGTHPVCACAHGMVAPDGKSCKGLCLHFMCILAIYSHFNFGLDNNCLFN